MNKVMLGLILAVCILGMALIMLNERLGRKTESRPSALTTMQANDVGLENEARKPIQELERQMIPDGTASMPKEPERIPEASSSAPLAEPGRKTEGMAQDLPEKMAPRANRTEDRQDRPENRAALPAAEQASSPQAKVSTPGEARSSEGRSAPKATPKPEPRPQQKATTASQAALPSQNGPAKADNPRKANREISKFVVFVRENGATLRLNANAPLHYKSMNLEDPPRVVLDLDGAWQIKAPAIPKNSLVSNVRIGQNGDKTRVVIDLKEKLRSTRIVPGNGGESLDMRLDK